MFPAPEFYVLYNGKRPLREDEKILRLSDSFLGTPDSDCSMELIVKVIDINIDSVDEPVHTCRYLNEYATFIGKIRENRAGGMELDQAIDESIRYCIENGIMVEFLQEYGQKVRSMIFTRLTDEEMRDILVESEVRIQVKEQVEEALKKLQDKVTQEVTDKITNEDMTKLISVMKELGIDKDVAQAKLVEKYGLAMDKASDIMERNW